jgi:hypothetical protein
MARVRLTFRRRDVTAAIKAVEAAGKEVFSVEITPEGAIRVITHQPLTAALPGTALDRWLMKHARET